MNFTKPLMLVTRMHTGTRFFNNLLKPYLGDHPEHEYWLQHCQNHVMDDIYSRMKTHTLVTTIREDDKIIASWMRRYGHMGSEYRGYDSQKQNHELIILPNADFVLSVDEVDREHRLAALGHFLDIEFVTDWRPVV
jgi:hypothetical protein